MDEKLSFNEVPLLISETEYEVYKNYRIENKKSSFEEEDYDAFSGREVILSPFIFENFELTEVYINRTRFPPGKYITWDIGLKRRYNPYKEKEDIFNELYSIGKKDNIKDKDILKFCAKYGLLKLSEGRHSQAKVAFRYNSNPFNLYPVEAFIKYAKEIYFIGSLYFLMYEEKILIQNRWRKIKNLLLDAERYLPVEDNYLDYIIDWHRKLPIWWNKNNKTEEWSDIEKTINIPYWATLNLTNDCKNAVRKYYNQKKDENLSEEQFDKLIIENRLTAGNDIYFGDDFHMKDLWEGFINNIDLKLLKHLTGEIIKNVTNMRINEDINFDTIIEYTNDNLYFYNNWKSNSLLTIIWLHFYSKITAIEDKYRYKICNYCEQIIEPKENKRRVNPKKKYHEGCRQKAYSKAKTDARQLFEEGYKVDEILESLNYDTHLDTIEKWLGLKEQSD